MIDWQLAPPNSMKASSLSSDPRGTGCGISRCLCSWWSSMGTACSWRRSTGWWWQALCWSWEPSSATGWIRMPDWKVSGVIGAFVLLGPGPTLERNPYGEPSVAPLWAVGCSVAAPLLAGSWDSYRKMGYQDIEFIDLGRYLFWLFIN